MTSRMLCESMSMAIAAVSSLLAFASPGAEDARSPTFAWSGVPGRALAPGLFADSLSRFGVEPGSLAEVATAPMGAHGERQVAMRMSSRIAPEFDRRFACNHQQPCAWEDEAGTPSAPGRFHVEPLCRTGAIHL